MSESCVGKKAFILTYGCTRICNFGEGLAAGGWIKKLADHISSARQETEASGVRLTLKACP